MKKLVQIIAIATFCQSLLIGSDALASLPVNYKSEGCVVGGKVFNLYQGKKQYTFELPKGFNLAPYEGKKVMLEGELTPGDYLVPKDKTLRILGPCTPSSGMNADWPAKPAAQPVKPATQPAKPTPPPHQASKPVVPQQPIQQPAALPNQNPKQPGAQPQMKPVQPAAASPVARPGQQPQNSANCRQNCQSQYDAKIRNCAGYNLGNSAPACKDPLTRELQSCMNSCR